MRWRLIAAFVGVTIVILAAQDIPLSRYLRTVEGERVTAGIERDAFILAGSSEGALSGEVATDPDALQATADVYAGRTNAQVVITDAAGIASAVSGDAARRGSDYSTRPEVATALKGSPSSGRRESETLGNEIVFVAVPVLSGALPVGVVRLTYPASTIDDRVSTKVRGILVVGLISLGTAALAAALMAATIIRPLRRLQRATELVAVGDFASRADIDEGGPEIRGLAASFNTMTERISTLVERQRSFAGDASHQLRTPLTALRLQLERAAANIDTAPEAARGDIEAANAETERLQRLVEGLLMLARADHGTVATAMIDVAAIVVERAAIWAPLADERGVALSAVPV
ncbi:MAG: histidine kinase dimerization/phospho-acceptor domain-containing protein, partial [Ilumatobacteraceae bacterium]